MVLNAYDASAVEEALVLTEKCDDVEVVCVGLTKASIINKALAMGGEASYPHWRR